MKEQDMPDIIKELNQDNKRLLNIAARLKVWAIFFEHTTPEAALHDAIERLKKTHPQWRPGYEILITPGKKGHTICFTPKDSKFMTIPRKPGYADLAWHPEDVIGLKRMSKAAAERFLDKYEDKIRDRLCELGHEVIGTFLAMDVAERRQKKGRKNASENKQG